MENEPEQWCWVITIIDVCVLSQLKGKWDSRLWSHGFAKDGIQGTCPLLPAPGTAWPGAGHGVRLCWPRGQRGGTKPHLCPQKQHEAKRNPGPVLSSAMLLIRSFPCFRGNGFPIPGVSWPLQRFLDPKGGQKICRILNFEQIKS